MYQDFVAQGLVISFWASKAAFIMPVMLVYFIAVITYSRLAKPKLSF